MRLLCLETAETLSRPVVIAGGSSELGARLGGRAPINITPTAAYLRYFATFPLTVDSAVEASLFVNPDPDFVFGGNMGRLLKRPNVELVLHEPSKRGAGSPFDGTLSEHALTIGKPTGDEVDEDGSLVPFSGHKIGGRPYFVHGEPSLETEVARLFDAGYGQCIQLDFPGGKGDVDVSGPWPFGTGLVHVLCTPLREGGLDWFLFWED